MMFFDTILSISGFIFIATAILVGPWFFGAWEMWWFWPFTVCIFLSAFFLSIRFILRVVGNSYFVINISKGITGYKDIFTDSKRRVFPALIFFPFLIYAFIRFLQADVFVDAERSFLMFFTSFILGMQILFGFTKKDLSYLYLLIILDLCCLGLYGIINHFITGSELVLWANGYPQYFKDGRASGSYFCPDHFSGIMELAFCLCFGVLMDRGKKRNGMMKILAAILLMIAISGIILSKSRGGGLSIVVVLLASLFFGFLQWSRATRWYLRGSVFVLLILGLVLFCKIETGYMNRFNSYFGWNQYRALNFKEKVTVLEKRLQTSSRGRMIAGAIRAWKTNKVFGIGPGMHQNLWFHFAASPDGDRGSGKWPTLLNNNFHSYEVHSDWVQLLEEYGLIGFLLFIIPMLILFIILIKFLYEETSCFERNNLNNDEGSGNFAILLGAILVMVCMAFHSLGDFNLQMPATAWLFTAILAISVRKGLL